MKRLFVTSIAAFALTVLLCAAAWAGMVAQGKCIENDKAAKTIKIEEYDINFTPENKYGTPTGTVTVFDVSEAKIGIPPEPGDILRIAYTSDNDKYHAVKVMNVTKQDLSKKK
ncbi:hypothetical protein [Desulfovibrio aminophilus]|uniref:hypothetical protein n=1 Tax=Desulfovibrio aminophilus TaxID=81425 RepID=UPI0004831D95|nr:hypothetical protein [Desulfovibrio aminophilus]